MEEETEQLEKLQEPTMLEDARKVVDDMKAANAERLKLIEREERLKAQEMLGGKSAAGEPSKPERSQEDIDGDARVLEVGKATGALWAKDMEAKND